MSICFDHITGDALFGESSPIFLDGAPATVTAGFVEERVARIRSLLGAPAILEDTLRTMEALSPDPVNLPPLLDYLKDGIAEADGRTEIRSTLRALARAIQPRAYLEIGTRRGWSLAQVAAECPGVRAWSVDCWIPAYGNVPNPGPGFVEEELERVAPAFLGRCHYLDGNSHDLLPHFLLGPSRPPQSSAEQALTRLSEARPRCFDLVTVDGDHTARGAWWDLCDVMPHVALGGAVVFDDLLDSSDEVFGEEARCSLPDREPAPPELRHSLLDVWQRIQLRFPNFIYLERLDAKPPVGVAIRSH